MRRGKASLLREGPRSAQGVGRYRAGDGHTGAQDAPCPIEKSGNLPEERVETREQRKLRRHPQPEELTRGLRVVHVEKEEAAKYPHRSPPWRGERVVLLSIASSHDE